MVTKCHYYLPQKKRTCSFAANPGTLYCGNHLSFVTGTEERVPCPFDHAHTIRVQDLKGHEFKCPSLLQRQHDQAQSYCVENCNAGQAPPADLSGADCPEDRVPATSDHQLHQAGLRTAQRIQYVHRLGQEGLHRLLHKVGAAHAEVSQEPQVVRELRLPECDALKPDHIRPFSLRHARQQASIAGNMHHRHLLQDAADSVFVEFGAGKGYLSSMICDSCPVRKVVMLDRQSFKLKADRSLRKVEGLDMQRLRVDIKDFFPRGLSQLQQEHTPWVAYGKHLCGAATDLTLRCCAEAAFPHAAKSAAAAGAPASAAETIGTSHSATYQDGDNGRQAQMHSSKQQDAVGKFRGLAVATCCHHGCAWEHYVGQRLFADLGFSPEEFEIISWMTGWALCGHEAPAGTGTSMAHYSDPDIRHSPEPGTAQGPHGRRRKKQREGPAQPAPPVQRRNSDAKPSLAGRASAPDGAGDPANLMVQKPPRDSSTNNHCSLDQQPALIPQQTEESTPLPQPHALAGSEAADALGGRSPAAAIPRDRRIAVGQMCKRLIDHGRWTWLQEQGFTAEMVLYVPPEVSGENRLLLATTERWCC